MAESLRYWLLWHSCVKNKASVLKIEKGWRNNKECSLFFLAYQSARSAASNQHIDALLLPSARYDMLQIISLLSADMLIAMTPLGIEMAAMFHVSTWLMPIINIYRGTEKPATALLCWIREEKGVVEWRQRREHIWRVPADAQMFPVSSTQQ